jgi:hypothetical protein
MLDPARDVPRAGRRSPRRTARRRPSHTPVPTGCRPAPGRGSPPHEHRHAMLLPIGSMPPTAPEVLRETEGFSDSRSPRSTGPAVRFEFRELFACTVPSPFCHDRSRHLISVRRGVGRFGEGATKTESSVREIHMLPPVRRALEAQRAARNGQSVWVFPNDRGGALNISNLRARVWRPALRRAGLRERTMYQTRHTFATLALGPSHRPAGPALPRVRAWPASTPASSPGGSGSGRGGSAVGGGEPAHNRVFEIAIVRPDGPTPNAAEPVRNLLLAHQRSLCF